jgi:flavin reductase (DIM6/NTAB) family NADH-FMN oxidoreductase RutF
MQVFTKQTIQSWERFYRGNFMNCISGFKSASLLGTIDGNGQTNLAIFSNIVHLGAAPAMIGIICRPAEAGVHTKTNIETMHQFTVNLFDNTMMQVAHQTSAKYDASISEFDAVGLTPEYLPNCIAPFVQQSKAKYSCTFVRTIAIPENNTSMLISTIDDVWLDETIINDDGFLHLEKLNTITSLGIDGYYTTSLQTRFSYAKNNTEPTILK